MAAPPKSGWRGSRPRIARSRSCLLPQSTDRTAPSLRVRLHRHRAEQGRRSTPASWSRLPCRPFTRTTECKTSPLRRTPTGSAPTLMPSPWRKEAAVISTSMPSRVTGCDVCCWPQPALAMALANRIATQAQRLCTFCRWNREDIWLEYPPKLHLVILRWPEAGACGASDEASGRRPRLAGWLRRAVRRTPGTQSVRPAHPPAATRAGSRRSRRVRQPAGADRRVGGWPCTHCPGTAGHC